MERWQIFRFTIRLCQQKRRQNTIQMTGVKLQLRRMSHRIKQQAVLLTNQEMQLTMQNEESTSLLRHLTEMHLLKKKIQQRSRIQVLQR